MPRPCLLVTAGLLVIGCSSVTPASFSASPPRVTASWRGPVSVAALHADDPNSRLNANGRAFEVDLDQFSNELARLVRGSLERAGTATGPGGRTLGVRVIYLDFMFQGPCLVDYSVELGSGEVFGGQSSGDGSIFTRACRVALESAVAQIVGDPRAAAYMTDD